MNPDQYNQQLPQPIQQPPQEYGGGRSKLPIVVAAIVGALLLIIIAVVAIVLISDDDSQPMIDNNSSLETESLVTAANSTTRRTDVGRLVAAITSHTTNQSGDTPSVAEVNQSVIPSYIIGDRRLDDFNDPTSMERYVIVAGTPELGEIQYQAGATCDGDSIVDGSSRSFALRAPLESGEFYCAAG